MTTTVVSIPLDGCKKEARSWVKARKGAWIHRAVSIIQAHNKSIEKERSCRSCGSSTPLLWEPPKLPKGWVDRFLAKRFPA